MSKIIVIGQPTEEQKAILEGIEISHLEGLTVEDIKNLSNTPQHEIIEDYKQAFTNFKDRHPPTLVIDKPLVYSDQHKKGRRGRKGNKTKKYF